MRAYEDCEGVAYSLQEAECFRYCGLTPTSVRPPGSLGGKKDSDDKPSLAAGTRQFRHSHTPANGTMVAAVIRNQCRALRH
jgi:hypothetical protein